MSEARGIPIELCVAKRKDGSTWVEVHDGRIMVTWGSVESAFVAELSPEAARMFACQLLDAAKDVNPTHQEREDWP